MWTHLLIYVAYMYIVPLRDHLQYYQNELAKRQQAKKFHATDNNNTILNSVQITNNDETIRSHRKEKQTYEVTVETMGHYWNMEDKKYHAKKIVESYYLNDSKSIYNQDILRSTVPTEIDFEVCF